MSTETQYRTFRDFYDAGDKGIGFVSSFDLRKSWYHPQIKIPVGERAAKWALVSQYGVLQGRDADLYWLAPSIEDVKTGKGQIRLTMSTPVQTRDDSDGKMIGFAIAGRDRRFYPANVQWYADGSVDNRNQPRYQRNVLVLSSPFVPEPAHFRHAWARNPMSNIVNGRGIPLATQRSDDWILEETPGKVDTSRSSKGVRSVAMQWGQRPETSRRCGSSPCPVPMSATLEPGGTREATASSRLSSVARSVRAPVPASTLLHLA